MSNLSLCKSKCKYIFLNLLKVDDLHIDVKIKTHIPSNIESIKYTERQH